MTEYMKYNRVFQAALALFMTLAMVLAISLPAGLAWANNDGNDTYYRVNDFTGSLTKDQEDDLSATTKEQVRNLQFDFVVYITDNDMSAQDLASGFYDKNNCGYGQDDDGIILALKPSEGAAAVYVDGLGSVIFSDQDTAALAADAALEVQVSCYDAVSHFLNKAINKVAAYRGVDVSAAWPALTAATTASEGGASSASSAEVSGSAGGEASVETTKPANGHTTAELPWYPADPKAFVDFHNDNAPRVVDAADLLTPDQEAQLEAKIADMRQRTGLDFVFYSDDSSYGLSRGLYAADFYQFNGYGAGDDYSGVIYFVCMEQGNRGFWTAARGSARTLLTEDNVNYMDDATYDLFKSGDYGEAVLLQFDNLDILYTDGAFPFDWTPVYGGIAVVVIVALVMGIRRLAEARGMMKTIAKASYAYAYRTHDPVFSKRTDRVVDVHVTRTKHHEPDSDSGSSSSGGSSSYSSSYSSSGGASFSGGGRSF